MVGLGISAIKSIMVNTWILYQVSWDISSSASSPVAEGIEQQDSVPEGWIFDKTRVSCLEIIGDEGMMKI